MLRKASGALAMAAVLSLAGCDAGGDGKAPEATAGGLPDEIVGTWKIVEAKGTMADANVGTVYKLEKDGKMIMGGLTTCSATYSAPALVQQCGPTFKVEWKVKVVDANTLVLDATGTPTNQLFTMKRQAPD